MVEAGHIYRATVLLCKQKTGVQPEEEQEEEEENCDRLQD